ncbi:kelch-like protein 6 [Amphiura filiformis]|uniref:kelch-like protein 6 n=1 Tax=Amphiura filiformis TaxID=82378 RepID=UPI003B21E7CC
MLTSEFQESQQSEATITGDADTFKVLLDFAYSGAIEVTMATVFSIMDMAHYLQFDYAMDRCVCFLENALEDQAFDSLNIEVALKILTRADLFGLDTLKKECKDYLAKNFKVSDEFVAHMTAELMEEMLERTDLTGEKEVFDATVAWLRHNWGSRKKFALRFLSKIRLGIVPIGHLTMTVFESPALYAIPKCKELIQTALKMYDANQPNDPPLHTQEPSLFATRTTVNAILCMGKVSTFYDVDKSSWLPLTHFPDLPLKDCAGTVDSCCNADGNLFVARGTESLPRRLKRPQFIKYDYVSNRWQTLAPMEQRRSKPLLVYNSRNGKIYAIGGDELPNTSCEFYSIRCNKWYSMSIIPADISHAVRNANPSSCVAYNGVILIYAPPVHQEVGSENEYLLGMYNPATGSWKILNTFRHPVPPSICGLVVVDGMCYRVVGGNCKCRENLCAWHEINVHELEVDIQNGSAVIGDVQDQSSVAARLGPLKKCAFIIDDELFVTANKHFHKIGVPNEDGKIGQKSTSRVG